MRSIRFLVPLLACAQSAHAEIHPVAQYNLQGQGGIRDTAAPPTLNGQAKGAPELIRQGSPKIMSDSPEPRRQVSDSSIKFEADNQCYNAPANLATGDRFVVEVWARATKENDSGWHALLANGDGGNGFLIAQNGGEWKVLIGGTGDTTLGKVVPGKWTHLAIVRDGLQCSGWLNGTKVCQLPALGGGRANFALGATAPGKESFKGWISEARVSTFEPGRFAPTDFLLDQGTMKVLQEAEIAKQTQFIRDLAKTPGLQSVPDFIEKPTGTDWLVSPPGQAATLQMRPAKDGRSAQLLMTNGIVSRTFLIADGSLGCISMRRIDKNIEFVRAVKPEARICLDGNWAEVGGLTGAPDQAFISESWLPMLQAKPGAFRLTGIDTGACVKPYEWQPKCNAPENIAWPAKGRRITFHFAAPDDSRHKGTGVDVSYEIYDDLPVMMKTFRLINRTGKEVVVTRFEGEHLAVQPTNSAMLHVESDYSFALANSRIVSSSLGTYGDGRAEFENYYHGGGTTRLVRDPNWSSMATLNQAEDLALDDPENALLLSAPPTGPDWAVKAGETFDAFRTFEVLNDSTDRERKLLALRRFYRKLAPQTNEKMFEVHAPVTRDMKVLGPLMDEMAEIGFNQLQAPEHPGGFNYADTSEKNVKSMKSICDYAKTKGIRVGAYQLLMASMGWGTAADNYNCIDPVSGKPGSAFGQSACGASSWADMYYDNMWKTIEATGMGAFKPDGPYHGDPCAATNHPHHRGLADSQWAQWSWMCKVLHEGQRRNLYLTVPDWYFLNGQACTGMGYREATDNIDIALQTVIYRQYIFDATWQKTAQMGWVNLNTEVLHGGMEKNLEKYERTFFVMLSSGAQVWVRGHQLYDGPESKAMLLKWMAWYQRHREVILGDIIHLHRPDGRDIDYTLHVNPGGREKGMLVVFNPLDRPVKKDITVPLYYTGLSTQATVRHEDGDAKTFQLDRDRNIRITVDIPANGYTWHVIE